MSQPKNVYYLSPPVFFEEKPMSKSLTPTNWVIYGVDNALDVNLIACIAELSGRLPARRGHDVTGYARRFPQDSCNVDGSAARDANVADMDAALLDIIEQQQLLWDGENGEDGLFAAHEIEIAEVAGEIGYGTEVRVSLDEPLDEECSRRVEYLLIVGLRYELNWAMGNTRFVLSECKEQSHMGINVDVDVDAIERAVELVSCRTRSLDVDIPVDTDFCYSYAASFQSAPSRLSSSIAAACAIAKSGCAGAEARRLASLIQEMQNAKGIWQEYADEPLNALSPASLEVVANRSGIAGFVRSYLADGIPLEDILA